MLPESEVAGEDADGDDAGGGEVAGGGEDAGGGDDAGGGGDDAGGGEDAGGGDDACGEEAGGDDAGCEDAGADDAGDWPGLEDPVVPPDDEVMIGVGGTDALENLDAAGLRYALGEIGTDAEGEAEDDALGLAGGLAAEEGAATTAPAPACGGRVWPADDRSAPINAKAARAEPATRPPVMHAEASVRETRCRPGRFVSRYRC